MAQLSVGVQLAVVLGAGLLVLAVLEGAHLLLFPRRVQKRLSGRYPAAAQVPDPVPETFQPRPQAPPTLQPANADTPRRWQRPERARPKSFTARMRRPQN
jgi:hypothetical protein